MAPSESTPTEFYGHCAPHDQPSIYSLIGAHDETNVSWDVLGKPVIGLLSRTLIRTPNVKWIFPARIRHGELNDLVYVGEDFVSIHEVLSDGHLQHIGTKADFGCRIRNARRLSRPTVDVRPSDGPTVKTEDEELPLPAGTDQNLPPHFIALTLESSELVFLFVRSWQDGRLELSRSYLALPTELSFLDTPGKHLALDSKGRAIAIGACQGTFVVLQMKDGASLQRDLTENPGGWTPCDKEKICEVDGIILHIEFLNPYPGDDDHVILLIIYITEKRTRAICYDWDHSQGLGNMVERAHSLEEYAKLPQFVIPLQLSPNFILVYDQKLFLYRDILSGPPIPTTITVRAEERAQYPGLSPRRPAWTGWTPVRRHPGYKEEGYYLIREDGVYHYIQIKDAEQVAASNAGFCGCHVGTAFACFDPQDLGGPDFVVAAGEGSVGVVQKIGLSRNEQPQELTGSGGLPRSRIVSPYFIETVPNWSPTLDLLLSPTSAWSQSRSHSSHVSKRDVRRRIFTTAGRQPYGAITELRYGLQARIELQVPVDGLSGMTGLWAMNNVLDGGVYVLLSSPEDSTLCYIPSDLNEFQVVETNDCHFVLDEMTISATLLQDNRSVQVTPRYIKLLEPTPGGLVPVSSRFRPNVVNVAAAFEPETKLMALVTKDQHGLSLEVWDVDTLKNDEEQLKTVLDSEPASLMITTVHDAIYVFLGDIEANIHVFKRTNSAVLTKLISYPLPPDSQTVPRICESMALLSSSPGRPEDRLAYLLLCGLRNGEILSVNLQFNSTFVPELGTCSIFGLGLTTARVFPDAGLSARRALVISGSIVCCADFSSGGEKGPDFSQVWFTDGEDPSIQQPLVSLASCIAPNIETRSDLASSRVIFISKDTIYLNHIQARPTTVPRRMPVKGSPTKVIASEKHGCLVVASVWTANFEGRQDRTDKLCKRRRVTRGIVQFIDPGKETLKSEEDNENVLPDEVLQLLPGERINSLIDWTCKMEDGNTRYYVVLATTVEECETESQSGQLVWVHATHNVHGVLHPKKGKVKAFDRPVYAVAALDDSSLVISTGEQLQVLRAVKLRWFTTCKMELHSPGLYLTVQESYIYVSTAQDSFFAYTYEHKYDEESDTWSTVLSLAFTDSGARETANHLVYRHPSTGFAGVSESSSEKSPTSSSPLVLVTDKQGSVAGLFRPRSSRQSRQTAALHLFEALLPRSITRIRQGSIRPPWSKAKPPGILANDIIGTAVDGSVYGFTLLNEDCWRLLKYLENVCTRHEAEQRRAEHTDAPSSEIDPDRDVAGLRDKTAYHVDGDALKRLLEPDGEDHLQAILRGDYGANSERDRLEALCAEAWGLTEEDWELISDTLFLELVVDWVKWVMAPMQ